VSSAPTGARDNAVESARAFAASSPGITRSRTLIWQDPLPAAQAATEMSGLEYVTAIKEGEIPPPPIAVVMNFSIVELDEGKATFDGEPGEEHYNPIGVVHGGYASTLLDSALGCAVHTTLAKGEAYTTQTLEVKFIRPITRDTGTVRVEAEVTHRGRRQAIAEAKLTAADSGKLLATGTGTHMVIRG
jgi:uncharacterized protein (TIGR00369 family)